MTESVKIPSDNINELPKKEEDGYYSFQVRMNIGDTNNEESPGYITTIVKLNFLPENFNPNDPNAISITLNGMKDESIGFPNRGFVSKYIVVSVDTAADTMIINLVCENADALHALHLDNAPFAQIKMTRDESAFVSMRPGEEFYMAIDLNPNSPSSSLEDKSSSVPE